MEKRKKNLICGLSFAALSVAALLPAQSAFAYGWQSAADGSTHFFTDASDTVWYADGWQSLSEDPANTNSTQRYYFFDKQGVLLKNTTTPDGQRVNEQGQWINQAGAPYDMSTDTARQESARMLQARPSTDVTADRANALGWQLNSGSWTYYMGKEALRTNGQVPVHQWLWIQDPAAPDTLKCYYFDGSANLAVNTTIDENQVDVNGAWVVNGVVQAVKTQAPQKFMSEAEVAAQIAQGQAYYTAAASNQTAQTNSEQSAQASSEQTAQTGDADMTARGEYALKHPEEAAGFQERDGLTLYFIDKDATLFWKGWLWVWDDADEVYYLYYFDRTTGAMQTDTSVDGYQINSEGHVLDEDGDEKVFHYFTTLHNTFKTVEVINSIQDDINAVRQKQQQERYEKRKALREILGGTSFTIRLRRR